MATTSFSRKNSRDRLYASEVNRIYDAINYIEDAINITPGTSNAQIPDSSLANGIDGAKLSTSSNLNVNTVTARIISITNRFDLSGSLNLLQNGVIRYNNGTRDIISIGSINPDYSMLVTDGVNTNFSIDREGNTFFRGRVNTLQGSVLTGELNATSGNFAGDVNVGGPFGITLKGSTGQIVLNTNGKIIAGANELSNDGLYLNEGSINLGDGRFAVTEHGVLFASQATLSGTIYADSGEIGGITIRDNSLSAGGSEGFTLSSDGYLTANKGKFTGEIHAQSGTFSGDMTVLGSIEAGENTISADGITIRQGSIQIGAGDGLFRVREDGHFEAMSANIHGYIVAQGGSFEGSVSAGTSVSISNDGISIIGDAGLNVSGKEGIKVKEGSIAIVEGDSNRNLITIGKYTDRESKEQYGLVVDTGAVETFKIDSDGNVSVLGHIQGTSGSFTGTIHATEGSFNDIDIIGELRVAEGGAIIVTDGSISAGSSIIDSTGIHLKQGEITLGGGAFTVNQSGKMTASDATIAGHIVAESGAITGNIEIGNGISIDGSTATIHFGESSYISKEGINIKEGAISLGIMPDGNPAFLVDTSGNLTAESARIKGEIVAQSGRFDGVVYAGNDTVAIGPDGVEVLGGQGITVTDGDISILNSDMAPFLKLGRFLSGTAHEHGIQVIDEIGEESFKITQDGSVSMKGDIRATGGAFAGKVVVGGNDDVYIRGDYAYYDSEGNYVPADEVDNHIQFDEDGYPINGTVEIPGIYIKDQGYFNSTGIHITGGTISIGDSFSVNSEGILEAVDANISGTITATEGYIAGIRISEQSLSAGDEESGFTISSTGQIIASDVKLSGEINATAGVIGGLTIYPDYIETLYFKVQDGRLFAQNAIISGNIDARSGYFGEGDYGIHATSDGLYSGGDGVAHEQSVFWIAARDIVNNEYDPANPIPGIEQFKAYAGDAYFRGSVTIDKESRLEKGDLVLKEGSIIAGEPTAAHIRITSENLKIMDGNNQQRTLTGPVIYASDNSNKRIFSIDKDSGAFFSGEIEARTGRITNELIVGSDNTVILSGKENSIMLFGDDEISDNRRIVRLDSLGLYVSTDNGETYQPALTGDGIDANVITDGFLTITDMGGAGASGILVRRQKGQEIVDSITITPDGIQVLDGSITVYSETTGEVLIGGGYLRVDGLDMGVVTSNNFVGNGNFNMVSEDYGHRMKTSSEVFLGQAHNHGGAISNPTYHYVGWPDHPERGYHDVWIYNINEDGSINDFDNDNPNDPNYPIKKPVSFNPQWVQAHPVHDLYVVPNDACNWLFVFDKNGNELVKHLAGRGGIFGVNFTPDGKRMAVCGDDIDRKRSPYEVVVFDTEDPDPKNWERLGKVNVGEFPSKVVCDSEGFAYVTVSLDFTIYKIDLYNLEVVGILNAEPGSVLQPIAISKDEEFIYVGSVTGDKIYVVPTHFNTPLDQCDTLSGVPYPCKRGMVHDLDVSPCGRYLVAANASILDGAVVLIDLEEGEIVDYIDSSKVDRLAIPPGATPEEIDAWNFRSTTAIRFHPTKPLIYATVTNRCEVSVLNYATGQLVEISRVPAGSNPSGVTASHDGTKLFVTNHHYHTYPLGSNRVWAYDADTHYYLSPEGFDTTQFFYHYNPSGIALIQNRYLWVANRATDSIKIIDTMYWDDPFSQQEIKDVGFHPYAIKATHDRKTMIVTNDDPMGRIEPDFITLIDIDSKEITGQIQVADRPMGLEISDDDKYVYVACYNGNMVQKAELKTKKIVASGYFEGNPRFLKLVGDELYVTCPGINKLYALKTNSTNGDELSIIKEWTCFNRPGQMAYANGKLYIVNEGYDTVQVLNVATGQFVKTINVGSMPNPIGYNRHKNLIYVGNAGEGSACIINPDEDEVIEWVMTGHSPEYITVSDDGEKWFISAHGPRDIIAYGEDKPFTGDAYLDNSGNTHKYGAAYWMPKRSPWIRAKDNTLVGSSSVEFWPTAILQDKLGYAQLNVLGLYDAYAQIEQDVYTLTNNSDGASDLTIDTLVLPSLDNENQGYVLLRESIANFSGLDVSEWKNPIILSAKNPEDWPIYREGTDFQIDYLNNMVRRVANSRIPESVSRVVTIPGNDPVPTTVVLKNFNTIEITQSDNPTRVYEEGIDYILDYDNNTIKRLPDGRIKQGGSVLINCSHLVSVRYYYHPERRNYKDVILSSDFYWRWPRPENQWVMMEIDELVPKFVIVDNNNTKPWVPVSDNINEEIMGVKYSAFTNRTKTAVFSSSATPISGYLQSLHTDTQMVELPAGEQYVQVDFGSQYYINEINITHANDSREVYGVKVQIWDGAQNTDWETVYEANEAPASYTIKFPETHTRKDGSQVTYDSSRRIRYIRSYCAGSSASTFNHWREIKAMGDWKVVTSYQFARDTIWDSEGVREQYVTLTGNDSIRFDGEEDDAIIRHRMYITDGKGVAHITPPSGYIQVFDLANNQYELNADYEWDILNNRIARTPNSKIRDGETVRVVYRFVQENLSQLPIAMPHKDPITGKPIGRGTVAETDVTGAWVEWEFENEFRCDWYIGWIADIAMGSANVYMDDELVHSISQVSSQVERFSQVSQDLAPGRHKVRLVQQQGTVNFDRIKLEDFQIAKVLNEPGEEIDATTVKVVAAPTLNPIELFTWYTDKMMPGLARKYLGRGSQITSGAYDTPRVDSVTSLPNYQVPIKYRVRFKTELQGRGVPDGIPDVGAGGEVGDRILKFEQGSVLITNVNFEEGVNPTYWRMSPGPDKYPGFMIEKWDPSKPQDTGIQTDHLANGLVTSEKIKSFSIRDQHIANNASIQESKLNLNFPTHPHENKATLDKLSEENGTLLFDGEPIESSGGGLVGGVLDGNLRITGSLGVDGKIVQLGTPMVVHRRPLYGLGGDLQLETSSPNWEKIKKQSNLFGYGCPAVPEGATRYYQLYIIYGDDISESDGVAPWVRIITDDASESVIKEWKLPTTGQSPNSRRDAYSDFFTAEDTGDNHEIQVAIQNDNKNYQGTDKSVGIEWIELIAYDLFNEWEDE